MTKMIQTLLLAALVAGTGMLAGCGQTENDVNGNDTAAGDATGHCGGCGPAAPGDAGAPSEQGDAGSAPSADGGAPAADAGSATPPADGGSASADAGTPPATDAGAPPADAGTPPATDAGTPAAHSAPIRSLRSNRLDFSDEYIGASVCGEIRGAIPGATWSSGPSIQDTDADHFLEYAPSSIAAGTYELSYVAKTCGGSAGAWADYGSRAVLLGMTADARSFVNCNWWDAATGTTLTVSSPGCNLRITVDGAGTVTGAGNMRDYH